jgi:hypothetical protein
MASIVADVAAAHRLPVADLMGLSRLKGVVVARQEAMWRIRQVMWADGVTHRYTLPQIGRHFSRDHTTVIHACKRHLDLKHQTLRGKNKRAETALLLSVEALERCRELLVIADTDADDLAEYDAATEAVRCNVEEFRLSRSPRDGGKQP